MLCLVFFRDGVPYCERDYQIQFGIQCVTCQKYITGKVLEVRNSSHSFKARLDLDPYAFFLNLFRPETDIITLPAPHAAAVTNCSQKAMKCMCKVSLKPFDL